MNKVDLHESIVIAIFCVSMNKFLSINRNLQTQVPEWCHVRILLFSSFVPWHFVTGDYHNLFSTVLCLTFFSIQIRNIPFAFLAVVFYLTVLTMLLLYATLSSHPYFTFDFVVFSRILLDIGKFASHNLQQYGNYFSVKQK